MGDERKDKLAILIEDPLSNTYSQLILRVQMQLLYRMTYMLYSRCTPDHSSLALLEPGKFLSLYPSKS